MASVRQGEVWWAELPLPAGRRPVLVLTRNRVLAKLSNVTVAPLTRTVRRIRSEVILTPDHGVPSTCAISLDNIMTIRKQRLDRRIVALTPSMLDEVFAAIRYALDMPDTIHPER